MILDHQLMFSDGQAVTGNAQSTNVIDLKDARDIGRGHPLWIMIQVTASMTDSGSNSTVAVSLKTDDNDNAPMDSAATLQTLMTIPAVSPAGSTWFVRVNPEILEKFQRYIALQYTLANGDLTTGSFRAGILLDPQMWAAYPSGFSVT